MNIKQEKKLKMTQAQIKSLDEILTMLRAEENVSPHFIAHKTRLPLDVIILILNQMTDRSILHLNFIIKCSNDDPDLIHGFEFNTNTELINFVRKNNLTCTHCNSNLNATDIRVSYYKKDTSKFGELYE